MNFIPLADRVLITPSEESDKSPGGVFIPDSVKEKPQQGTVKAIGAGKLLDDGTKARMTVEIGDTVLYPKYTGTEITIDGQDYLVLPERDILGILEL